MSLVHLDELFLSIQGEAGQVGKPHLFLRLAGCPLRCNYCDTPRSWKRTACVEVHHPGGTVTHPNPWSPQQLDERLHALAAEHGLNATDVVLSVTGGEPLAQVEFLSEWLPTWQGPVLLETAGIYADKLARVLPHLDYVSLDCKDPDDLDVGEGLLQFERCLQLLVEEQQQRSGAPFQFWLKFVLQKNTCSAWLQQKLRRIAERAPGSEVYLQPVTPGETDRKAPSADSLLAELIQGHKLPLDLRVLPQIHPLLGVL